jgi:hypothetical protein
MLIIIRKGPLSPHAWGSSGLVRTSLPRYASIPGGLYLGVGMLACPCGVAAAKTHPATLC